MTHDYVHLARSLQLDSLETAWAQALQNPKPEDAPRYAATIEALCEKEMAGKALGLAVPMIEALSSQGQLDAAIDIGQKLVRRGAHNEAVARNLVGLLEKRFAEEEWFPLLRERAGLAPGQITAQAILEFDRLRRFTKGHVVYHSAGWGEGVIEGFIAATREITVTFASGRSEDFPLDTVISRFKPLDHDDLRAMKLLRLAELQREATELPAVLIRRAAKLYRGTITSQQLKHELVPAIVPEREWTSFWKRAKTAVTKDPWLKVEGSAARPSFVLRDRPVGIAEEAANALRHQNDLGQRISVLRDFFERGSDDEVRSQILDLAAKTIEAAVAEKKASHAHILDGILFLVEHGRQGPVPAAQEVRALLVGPEGALHFGAIDRLATQASREHAIELLPEALGEQWAEKVLAVVADVPTSVLEHVVDLLVQHRQGERLLDLWDRVAPYPRRYPVLTYLLGRLYNDGIFEQRPDKPAPVTVGRVLLHLGRILNAERKGNPLYNRLLGRLVSLMSGKRGFLHRALEGISREDLASYLGITERGGEDFPQEIVDMVLREISRSHPDLTETVELPFWERVDNIFTTRAGFRRIKEEYRKLVDERIPTNSKAIGAAAALGDLSENSEWESAMEEQRNLTTRATAMDQEIRSARILEEQEIPTDVVAPGTRVTLVEEQSGQQRTYTLLGPWDGDDESTINYKAPFAQGMLGRRVGDVAEVPSPQGPIRVKIERIERAL